jgi:hypothetical protein
MEVLTDGEGNLRPGMQTMGYQLIPNFERDGLSVEVGLDTWREPYISTSGRFKGSILKGGITVADGSQPHIEAGGIHEKGIVMGVDDEYGDR